MEPNTYNELRDGHVRIFDLQLEPKDLIMTGYLRTVNRPKSRPVSGSSEAYEALSYTWGDTHADGSHHTHTIV